MVGGWLVQGWTAVVEGWLILVRLVIADELAYWLGRNRIRQFDSIRYGMSMLRMTSSNPIQATSIAGCRAIMNHTPWSTTTTLRSKLACFVCLFVCWFVRVFECGFQLDTIGEPIEALRDSGAFDQ